MPGPTMDLEPVEPQSLKKLSLKSLKCALDLFTPTHGRIAPPDSEIPLASASTSITALRSVKTTPKRSKQRQQVRVIGDFSHFGDAVRKDMEFLKKGISKGIGWANQTFRLPQVSKTLDDVLWLRNVEDPRAAELEPRDWPQPSYPGLIGVDLLMADLKAMEAYVNYFYHISKIWSKPLPEVYNAQCVADYFNCRPHIVALRLLELCRSLVAIWDG